MNPMSTQRNRYFSDRHTNVIFTPPPLSQWLHDIIIAEYPGIETVFDPAVGSGNLLDPFVDENTIGCDIVNLEPDINHFFCDDFLTWKGSFPKIDLVIMNPPYNHSVESAKKWGRGSLLPELFAERCFDLFGNDIKMAMFTPMGFRLNTRSFTTGQGSRYRAIRDVFAPITSIVSLPLDVFPNNDFDPAKDEVRRNPKNGIMKSNIKRKETQQEILLFNMPELKPHYCLPESLLADLREMDRELWG